MPIHQTREATSVVRAVIVGIAVGGGCFLLSLSNSHPMSPYVALALACGFSAALWILDRLVGQRPGTVFITFCTGFSILFFTQFTLRPTPMANFRAAVLALCLGGLVGLVARSAFISFRRSAAAHTNIIRR